MEYKIFWTEEALQNLEGIIHYLSTEFSQKEINDFKKKLSRHVDHIRQNPLLFPRSSFQPRLRKAVISKQTSVFYEVNGNMVYLVYVFVNYQLRDRLR